MIVFGGELHAPGLRGMKGRRVVMQDRKIVLLNRGGGGLQIDYFDAQILKNGGVELDGCSNVGGCPDLGDIGLGGIGNEGTDEARGDDSDNCGYSIQRFVS